MKSRHNITQDRLIVNTIDDTSDALRSSMLAPPVCTVADSPTANWGAGCDERPQRQPGVMAQHGGLDHFYGYLWNSHYR